jgi:hypothetical protein
MLSKLHGAEAILEKSELSGVSVLGLPLAKLASSSLHSQPLHEYTRFSVQKVRG